MVVGVDIGGTKVLLIEVKNGKIVKRKKVLLKRKDTREIFEIIFEFVKDLKDKRIGIAIPGYIVKGKYFCPNLPKFDANKLKRKLERKRFRIKFENDANCFALANKNRFKEKHIIGITLGTGVGGGIVIDGKLYKGRNNAGEFGHGFFENRIEIEKVIGSKGLERMGHKNFKRKISSNELFELAKRENKKAKKVFEEYGKLLGKLLSTIHGGLDPQICLA